jgi:hypothetical protein
MLSSPLVAIGIEAFQRLLLEIFHQKGIALVNRVDIDLTSQSQKEAIENYVKNYLRRHGQIKVLNMRDSVRLEEIYTDAELMLGFQDASGLESTEELHDQFTKVGNLLSIHRDRYERAPALEFVKEYNRLVILGGPGAGKSTLLKKVGIETWKQTCVDKTQKQFLPVFIELKIFSEYTSIDIKQQIIREFQICGFTRNILEVIEKLLEKGRLLIILDGLDELTEEKRLAAIVAIQDFSDQYNRNRFLVSCRAAAYQFRRLNGFKDVEIAGFEDKQIYKAICNWFAGNMKVAMDCWEKLNSEKNRSVKKLANTPLLLTLICIYYQQTLHFPVNQSALYEKAISVLLEEWNISKGFLGRYENLDAREKEFFLEAIAYEYFQKNKMFMYQRMISHRIDELKADMGLNPDIGGDEIINIIELDNGIFLKQADQVYSFSHTTIQEYFCAQYITKSFSRIQENVKNYILDERWQGVFIFLSGLRQNEDVLDIIEKESNTYAEALPIMKLLSWATKSTINSGGELLPVIRRIFAVHIALCFHLYFSATDKRFNAVLKTIRMCQKLIKEFNDDIPGALRQDLLEFEKLIAALITTRQNSNAYNESFKSISGKKVAVRDMRKQVSLVCRQCETATNILSKNRVFRNVKTDLINRNCRRIGQEALASKETADKYLTFCNQFAMEWINALNLEQEELNKLDSKLMEKFFNHLYCLYVLKLCGDTAKHFSISKWALRQNRMLFSKWVSAEQDVWK